MRHQICAGISSRSSGRDMTHSRDRKAITPNFLPSYNIEMDPSEQHNLAGEHDFAITAFQTVYRQLVASMKQYPNTPSRAYPIVGGAS